MSNILEKTNKLVTLKELPTIDVRSDSDHQ